MRDTPPGRLARMYAAREREHAWRDLDQADLLMMVGDDDRGHESKWQGSGNEPKSSYRVTDGPLQAWLDRKRRVALGLPPKTEIEQIRDDAKAWRDQLSQLKAMQA